MSSSMDRLERAQEDGVVLGLHDVAGVQPRLDIDQLILQEPDTFNLFVLALNELMDFSVSGDKMGYFQNAGKLLLNHRSITS